MNRMTNFFKKVDEKHNELHNGMDNVLTGEMIKAGIIQKRKETDAMIPVKTGQLYKYSPALFQGWQERYFTVKDGKIKWFKDSYAKIP
jgi:hypothetical protein